LRILHTSDLHLGSRLFSDNPSFKKAFHEAFKEIAEIALSKSCSLVLVSGDLFDSSTLNRIDTETVLRSVEVLRELKKHGVKVVVSPGNHDIHLDGEGVLDLLEKAELILKPGVRVGDLIEVKPLDVDDYTLLALPGLRNSSEVDFVNSRRIKIVGEAGGRRIVMAHSIVDIGGLRVGDLVPRLSGEKSVSLNTLDTLFPQTIYFALGHVHYPLPLEKTGRTRAAYPGAPIGYDLNDLLDSFFLKNKGIRRRVLLVDLEGETPRYEAVELSNTPDVGYVELPEKVDLATALNTLSEVLGRLKKPWRVVVVSVSRSVDNTILAKLRTTAERESAYAYIRVRGVEEAEPFALTSLTQVSDLFESERRLLEQLLPRYGLKIPPDRVQELIDLVSRGVPVEDIIREILKAVGEVE